LSGLLSLALVVSGCQGACNRTQPSDAVSIKGKDGKTYLLLDRGQYKGIYDQYGRIERIEYDSNNDGKPDHIAYHKGEKSPRLLEVDENFDGKWDRWEDYDENGRLTKVGYSRRGQGPDMWLTPGPGDIPSKREFDEDGDMKIDRTEILEKGLIVRVELDTNKDGKVDRWQDWSTGKLTSEDLDTDENGKPDRRLLYNKQGRLLQMDPLPQ
jgi:hypothetical protein